MNKYCNILKYILSKPITSGEHTLWSFETSDIGRFMLPSGEHEGEYLYSKIIMPKFVIKWFIIGMFVTTT